MIAVLFEVEIATGRRDEYLEYAGALAAELERIDGFVSIERFQSLTVAGKLLSLSYWRDEDAVARWRAHEGHRAAQLAGRGGIFADYRLRVASVIRDYGMTTGRDQAPVDFRTRTHGSG